MSAATRRGTCHIEPGGCALAGNLQWSQSMQEIIRAAGAIVDGKVDRTIPETLEHLAQAFHAGFSLAAYLTQIDLPWETYPPGPRIDATRLPTDQ